MLKRRCPVSAGVQRRRTRKLEAEVERLRSDRDSAVAALRALLGSRSGSAVIHQGGGPCYRLAPRTDDYDEATRVLADITR